ncbi:MAG: hypothetical protein ACOX0Z_01720 [Candidatus Nanosyncoccaceae bacterium]|jgi:hypothetical protein
MQLKKSKIKVRRGDTIVETMFAFAVFGLVAIINIQIMQRGTRLNQTALEINLVREQITAQAEALRLINSAYIAEYVKNQGAISPDSEVNTLWKNITGREVVPGDIKPLSQYIKKSGNYDVCDNAPVGHAFILDYRYRHGLPQIKTGSSVLQKAELFSRVRYSLSGITEPGAGIDANIIEKGANYTFQSADGIWIEVVGSGSDPVDGDKYKYFDFLIRACWDSPASRTPTTLETMVRLHVPK